MTYELVFGRVVFDWLWLRLDRGLRRRAGNSRPCCDGDGDGDTVDSIDERVNCELIIMNN